MLGRNIRGLKTELFGKDVTWTKLASIFYQNNDYWIEIAGASQLKLPNARQYPRRYVIGIQGTKFLIVIGIDRDGNLKHVGEEHRMPPELQAACQDALENNSYERFEEVLKEYFAIRKISKLFPKEVEGTRER